MAVIGAGITIGAGINLGPSIVTNGLIEYLDAADYTGSGSTWPARIGTNATLYNNPTWNSEVGYFDFSPASLQFADIANLGDLSNWTVEAWFRTTADLATTDATAIVTTVYENGAGTNYGTINYTLTSYNGGSYNPTLQTGYYNGTWHETGPAVTPEVGIWYQMVGTFNGTTLISYINGELESVNYGGGGTSANGAPTRIARRWDGTVNDTVQYFPGQVAIVRIYNTALTANQVLQNYQIDRSRFVVTNGLILNLDAGNPNSYPGSGNTWTDLVSAKVFTLYNNPTYSSNNGGYLNFNPSSSQWADATSFPSSLSNWTLEAWHYYAGSNDSGSPCIVTEAYAGGPINFTLGNCTDSSPNVQVGYWDGNSFHPTPQGTVLTAGNWYQVVGTYDGSYNRLYINGAFVSSTASTSASLSSGAGIRLMSRWDYTQYWGGRLGIVRIYDAALTAEQITQNFYANRSRFGI